MSTNRYHHRARWNREVDNHEYNYESLDRLAAADFPSRYKMLSDLAHLVVERDYYRNRAAEGWHRHDIQQGLVAWWRRACARRNTRVAGLLKRIAWLEAKLTKEDR